VVPEADGRERHTMVLVDEHVQPVGERDLGDVDTHA
jgi:hypothetical protein